jgi:hypothetical protein
MGQARTWGALAGIVLALTGCGATPDFSDSTAPFDSERPPVNSGVAVPVGDAGAARATKTPHTWDDVAAEIQRSSTSAQQRKPVE